MGEAKFALLSRHVILPQYPLLSLQLPVSALLFIQDEVIQEVRVLGEETNVQVM
jgi:hypothetical protein